MGGLDGLWEALSNDPVLTYSLAAAALLTIVSIGTGLLRLDIAALFRPRILLRVTGAVVLAFLISLLAGWLDAATGPGSTPTLSATLYRFPLYLITLAYGPTIGLFTAALYAAFHATAVMPGWNEVLLALELVVLGWLAIYPSPRSSRWSGPFDAPLAYALAWGTGGLAMLQASTGSVTSSAIGAHLTGVWQGLLLVALALALVGPRTYARWFPGSRIAPQREPASEPHAHAPALPLSLEGRSERSKLRWSDPSLPITLEHDRPQRELDIAPFRPELESLR